jgi:pterin-4a-carbinolamine dehydratase
MADDDYPLIDKWETHTITQKTITSRCTINSEDMPLSALAEIVERAKRDGHPPDVNVQWRKNDVAWEVTLITRLPVETADGAVPAT